MNLFTKEFVSVTACKHFIYTSLSGGFYPVKYYTLIHDDCCCAGLQNAE